MAGATPFDLNDPQWYAHRFVESDDTFRFIRLERAAHASAPFLTDDCLGHPAPARDLPTAQCLAEARPGPLHLLFHSAFCGSTMLARALDRPGTAMGLSEPVTLNDVVGFRRRGAEPRAVARAADAALRLLARPYGPGEAVVVKPSNVVNPLAEALLRLNPDAKAVFLYSPLETFLISVARKGLPCRLWARELLEGFLRENFVRLGFTPEDIFRQSDLQVAALGWLAQHKHFTELAVRLGSARMATLDADRMIANPAAAIDAVARHYGLTLDNAGLAEIAAGRSLAQHSKSGEAFTSAERTDAYARARVAHGEEIDLVLQWAGKVAEAATIPFEAPYALMPDQA